MYIKMWYFLERSGFRNHAIQLYASVAMSNYGVEVFNSLREGKTVLLLVYVMLPVCDDIAVLSQIYKDGISIGRKCRRLHGDTDKYATGSDKGCSISGFKAEYIRRLDVAFVFYTSRMNCHDLSMWKTFIGVFTE